MTSPTCPCCGGTQARFLQKVNINLLRRLWHASFGFTPKQLLPPTASPSTFACDCGLVFFEPRIAGDGEFYRDLYSQPFWSAWLRSPPAEHGDFVEAAAWVRPGDAVLDVGGHAGTFGSLLPPGSETTVLDPYAEEYGMAGVLRQTAAEHAALRPAHYDVACAFQVIEHVEDPLSLAQEMLACLKPGGLLIFSAPTTVSRLTAVPNMVMNAPPHHLSLWSPAAFLALAARLGLTVEKAEVLPASRGHYDRIYWLERLTPTAPPERMFIHNWRVHAQLFLAFKLQPLLNRLFGSGPLDTGIDAFLVARKP